MKKTCFGCRALEKNSRGYHCVYGFKIEVVLVNKDLILTSVKPLEECPKPKTVKRYIECFKDCKR